MVGPTKVGPYLVHVEDAQIVATLLDKVTKVERMLEVERHVGALKLQRIQEVAAERDAALKDAASAQRSLQTEAKAHADAIAQRDAANAEAHRVIKLNKEANAVISKQSRALDDRDREIRALHERLDDLNNRTPRAPFIVIDESTALKCQFPGPMDIMPRVYSHEDVRHTTPFEREILTHYFTTSESMFRAGDRDARSNLLLHKIEQRFTRKGLLRYDINVDEIRGVPEALEVYMAALAAVPLPVKTEKWEVPSN